MATISNARNSFFANEATRVLAVTLPPEYSTSGDHTGTLSGSAQTNFQNSQITLSNTGQLLNAGGGGLTQLDSVTGNYLGNWEGVGRTFHRNDQITLSSSGVLNNAGGGAITALDYSNVAGSKPPSNATANFFTQSGSNPSGGSDGAAHWNSTTSTMWFKINGSWQVGGTINANQITVGTLAAARIAANSITTDKLNIGGSLSNISTNLGTVSSGNITSGVSLSVNGSAVFNGSSDQGFGAAAVNANTSLNSTDGVIGRATFGNGIRGLASSGAGVLGTATSAGGVGGQFTASGGADALQAFGPILLQGSITLQTQTISNLTVGTAGVAGNATNANQLGGVADTGWCRVIACESGTATAGGHGFQLFATVTNINTVATGGNAVEIRDISDRRTKTEIQPETLGLDFIKMLNPVTFKSNGKGDLIRHGFVSDDIGDLGVLPEHDSLFHVYEDGMKGTDYICLLAPLVNAVKTLSNEIDDLRGQLRRLQPIG